MNYSEWTFGRTAVWVAVFGPKSRSDREKAGSLKGAVTRLGFYAQTLGGDDRIRTGDKGFADPRLNHLATSPKIRGASRFPGEDFGHDPCLSARFQAKIPALSVRQTNRGRQETDRELLASDLSLLDWLEAQFSYPLRSVFSCFSAPQLSPNLRIQGPLHLRQYLAVLTICCHELPSARILCERVPTRVPHRVHTSADGSSLYMRRE
jgi:hypothetical protein